MAKSPRRSDDDTFVLFNRRQIGTLLAGITAIALLSFALGFLVTRMLAEPEVKAPAGKKAEEPSYSIIKPKQLDAGKIMDETGEKSKAAAPAPGNFTFPETLTRETAPAANPFNPPKETVEKHEKAPVHKVEKKQAEEKPKTAASEPAPKKPVKTSEKPKPKTAPAPKKEDSVAKTAPRKGKELTIQVGSFTSKADAEKLKNRLVKKDFNAYVQSFELKGKTWHRVRVGVFKTKNAAQREAKRLEKSEKLPTLVVTYQRG